MSLEIPVQSAIIGGKRYSNCVLRLDRASMAIEILCKVGFISKKTSRVLEIRARPLDLIRITRSGKISWEGSTIEIQEPQARQLIEEIKRHIIEKSSQCISEHIKIFKALVLERARALKELSEISSKPREKIIEYVRKAGEETIASSEDVLEKAVSIIEGSLRERIGEALKNIPECPDTPRGSIDRVSRIFLDVVEIQNMIHGGAGINAIQAKIEKMGEIIGGFSEEARKKMLEALGIDDLEKKCEALIETMWLDIYQKISHMISEDLERS